MVSASACAACASVGLPPCFSEAGCLYQRVSLTRPTGRKAPRRPGMPETMRMVAASSESQKIGEFLEWLTMAAGYVLGQFDESGRPDHRLYPVHVPIERLLARYYGIDLDRVERERGRMLAYLRRKGDA